MLTGDCLFPLHSVFTRCHWRGSAQGWRKCYLLFYPIDSKSLRKPNHPSKLGHLRHHPNFWAGFDICVFAFWHLFVHFCIILIAVSTNTSNYSNFALTWSQIMQPRCIKGWVLWIFFALFLSAAPLQSRRITNVIGKINCLAVPWHCGCSHFWDR